MKASRGKRAMSDSLGVIQEPQEKVINIRQPDGSAGGDGGRTEGGQPPRGQSPVSNQRAGPGREKAYPMWQESVEDVQMNPGPLMGAINCL